MQIRPVVFESHIYFTNNSPELKLKDFEAEEVLNTTDVKSASNIGIGTAVASLELEVGNDLKEKYKETISAIKNQINFDSSLYYADFSTLRETIIDSLGSNPDRDALADLIIKELKFDDNFLKNKFSSLIEDFTGVFRLNDFDNEVQVKNQINDLIDIYPQTVHFSAADRDILLERLTTIIVSKFKSYSKDKYFESKELKEQNITLIEFNPSSFKTEANKVIEEVTTIRNNFPESMLDDLIMIKIEGSISKKAFDALGIEGRNKFVAYIKSKLEEPRKEISKPINITPVTLYNGTLATKIVNKAQEFRNKSRSELNDFNTNQGYSNLTGFPSKLGCATFVSTVLKECGINIYGHQGCDDLANQLSSSNQFSELAYSKESLQAGDIVFWSSSKNASDLNHVGIITSINGDKVNFINFSSSNLQIREYDISFFGRDPSKIFRAN